MNYKPRKAYNSLADAVLNKGRGDLRRPIAKKKPKIVQLRIVKTPQMKQYGDKGYKPSNGRGVSY